MIHVGFDAPPKLVEQEERNEEKLVHYRKVRDEIKDFILSLPDSLANQ